MIRRAAVFTAAAWAIAASAGLGAQERVERTGSRLSTDTTPRTVYQFSAPGEVGRVLQLLEQGRTDEAVELARDYLASLSSVVSASGTSVTRKRYFALNALCVALTKAGSIDEAVDTCTEAIELFPSRWTALNSRGTAYYASREFGRALADYVRALEVAPGDESVRATIEHNMALAEQRVAEDGGR